MSNDNNKKVQLRKTTIIWSAAAIIVIFLFIFSMFHLQQRGEYKLDDTLVDYNYSPEAYQDVNAVGDFSNSSADEVNGLIPQLKLNYENAQLNGNYMDVQAAGMTLAMAYLKMHDRKNCRMVLNQLMEEYPYDSKFVAQCEKVLKRI